MLTDLSKIREGLQAPSTASITDIRSRDGSQPANAPSSETIDRSIPKTVVGVTRSKPRVEAQVETTATVEQSRPRLSAGLLAVVSALCLGGGAAFAWSGRAPDVLSLTPEAGGTRPCLWLEPLWKTIPKQATADEQCRFAQIQAPPAQWVAAWLAVPGNFPHSHEANSRAYIQLARIFYRRGDVEALGALVSEISDWGENQKRDQELVSMSQIAIKSQRATWRASSTDSTAWSTRSWSRSSTLRSSSWDWRFAPTPWRRPDRGHNPLRENRCNGSSASWWAGSTVWSCTASSGRHGAH
jgi:hypothetical protein